MRRHVPEAAAGRRLASFLAELPEIGSRAVAERLLGTGGVLVDGRSRLNSHKLVGGEELEFAPDPAAESALTAQSAGVAGGGPAGARAAPRAGRGWRRARPARDRAPARPRYVRAARRRALAGG